MTTTHHANTGAPLVALAAASSDRAFSGCARRAVPVVSRLSMYANTSAKCTESKRAGMALINTGWPLAPQERMSG